MSRTNPSLGTVLAATDFSPDAREAVARAFLLSSQHNAQLVLMHVLDLGPWLAIRDTLQAERDLGAKVAEQAEMQLAAAARSLEQYGQASRGVRTQLTSGRPVQELLDASERADLLVLGASGDHPIRDISLGSTAEQLSRLVNRPLLVARGMPTSAYRQVLALVDFSAASIRALELATVLAPDAAFHLLHCMDLPYLGRMKVAGVDEEALENYKARARHDAMGRLGQLVSTLPSRERVTAGAEIADVRMHSLQQAGARGADLIVLGKQGQSLLADSLLGSVTAFVLANAECDVLVHPARSGS